MVQCILHGLMGIGRLVCTFVEDQVDDYGSSKGKAVAKILRVCRVRWQLGRTPKPTGEGTWRLLLFAWPKLVKWFGLEGAPADIAVRDMTSLLRRLYSTWASDSAMAECKEISGRFRQEIAPRSASHYLLFFEEICPILLPTLGKFGLGLFAQDAAESLNHLLKVTFLTMTNRGGGVVNEEIVGTGHADRLHREASAMRQTMEYIFLYFSIPLHMSGYTRWHASSNKEISDEVQGWLDGEEENNSSEEDEG